MIQLKEIAEIAIPELYTKPILTIGIIVIGVLGIMCVIMSLCGRFIDWIQQR